MLKFKFNEQFFTELAIICTVLAFTPAEAIARIMSLVMYAMWGTVFLWKFTHNRFYVGTYSKLLFLFYVYWWAMSKLLHATGDYRSDNMGVAIFTRYCLIFHLMGYNFTKRNKEGYFGIYRAFIIGITGVLLTMVPYLAMLRSSFYLFEQKNQMGQLIGAAICLEMFIIAYFYRTRRIQLTMYGLGAFSMFMLMIIHSRTPLVAVLFIFVLSFVERKDKTVKDYITFVGIGFSGLIAIYFLGGMDFFTGLFESSDNVVGSNSAFNVVTSGRGDLYLRSFQEFLQHPLWGLGSWAYVDNFVINSLRCGGLAMSVPMLPLVYLRLWKNFKRSRNQLMTIDKKSDLHLLLTGVEYMTVFYFLISLMEAYPPLGPSTAVFFLWFLTGIVDRIWEKDQKEEEGDEQKETEQKETEQKETNVKAVEANG